MSSTPRRVAAIGLAVLLLVGVGYAIVSSVRDTVGAASAVHGIIGSEKEPLFHDPRVLAALRRGGFAVTVNTAGSRQITGRDLAAEDFAFPAGVRAAERIGRDHAGSQAFVPFCETLESTISRLEAMYSGAGLPSPATSSPPTESPSGATP